MSLLVLMKEEMRLQAGDCYEVCFIKSTEEGSWTWMSLIHLEGQNGREHEGDEEKEEEGGGEEEMGRGISSRGTHVTIRGRAHVGVIGVLHGDVVDVGEVRGVDGDGGGHELESICVNLSVRLR